MKTKKAASNYQDSFLNLCSVALKPHKPTKKFF